MSGSDRMSASAGADSSASSLRAVAATLRRAQWGEAGQVGQAAAARLRANSQHRTTQCTRAAGHTHKHTHTHLLEAAPDVLHDRAVNALAGGQQQLRHVQRGARARGRQARGHRGRGQLEAAGRRASAAAAAPARLGRGAAGAGGGGSLNNGGVKRRQHAHVAVGHVVVPAAEARVAHALRERAGAAVSGLRATTAATTLAAELCWKLLCKAVNPLTPHSFATHSAIHNTHSTAHTPARARQAAGPPSGARRTRPARRCRP